MNSCHAHQSNANSHTKLGAHIVISTTGSSEMDSAESSEFSTSSLTVVYRHFPGCTRIVKTAQYSY